MEIELDDRDIFICAKCKEAKVDTSGLIYFRCCNMIYCVCMYESNRQQSSYNILFLGCINPKCFLKLCETDYWR